MKFTIDGREYEDYQLSNEQIVRLIEGDNKVTDIGEEMFLKNKVYERFKNECCARKGESRDELFARNFSDYVNRCPNDFRKAASAMGRDHRYLQSEMFKLCIEYFKVLDKAYLDSRYDARNEWAVKTANEALCLLRAEDWAI